MGEAARRGFALFAGKASCTQCHIGWRLTDDGFHDTGLPDTADPGRGPVINVPMLNNAFKTPPLRNVARRLRAEYVNALEGGLRRQGSDFDLAVEYSMADFTVARSMAGLDQAAVLKALGRQPTVRAAPPADPVVAAIVEFRSGDPLRIRAALRNPPRDPPIIAALVQLLANDDAVRMVVAALIMVGLYRYNQRRGSIPPWTRKDLYLLILLGVLGVGLNQLFFVAGISMTTVSHAAIIIGLTPLIVLMLAAAGAAQDPRSSDA